VKLNDFDPHGIVAAVLSLPADRQAAILDSCGSGHLGSHLMIAGIDPIEVIEINGVDEALVRLVDALSDAALAAVFTISYDFGLPLIGLRSRHRSTEPGIYIALYDSLLIHDYLTGETRITGEPAKKDAWSEVLQAPPSVVPYPGQPSEAVSNFTREAYLSAVDEIKELIRDGETYQTNLTQQLSVRLPEGLTPANIFDSLRTAHPPSFSAYLERGRSTVVSASPERFFRIEGQEISASPIKGTIRRTGDAARDRELREQLLNSKKDIAENTMIVDLVRNDLGRVCEFGSVGVAALCEIEEHPTLYHLVSTVNGRLRDSAGLDDILNALFPCGSITGAPKRRTMEIIDRIEPDSRGLSMGTIGIRVPDSVFDIPGFLDTNVAIRTMTIADGKAVFNVGGGITIESDAECEYDESLLKAKALLTALGDARLTR
jgi:para-aminobenzoate synthetase component I